MQTLATTCSVDALKEHNWEESDQDPLRDPALRGQVV